AWAGAAPPAAAGQWFYPLAFVGLGVAHAGVRLGRKTYLVDMAEGDRRTDYVAVSNSAIGLALLVAGGMGALASAWSVPGTVALLGAAGLAGAALSLRWEEV
ncbi:MAG TPA: hypothetical protein PKA84_14350, partial [Rubrivivax sp.]|nr:hypothetical protein [Rubrivivax sp.]